MEFNDSPDVSDFIRDPSGSTKDYVMFALSMGLTFGALLVSYFWVGRPLLGVFRSARNALENASQDVTTDTSIPDSDIL